MPLLRSGRITSMPMNINCYANKKRKYYDDEDFAPPLKKYRQKTKIAPRITAKRIRRQSQKVTAAVHRTPIVETHNIPSRALVILTDTESEEETQEPVRQVDLSSVSLIPDMKNSHHSRNNRDFPETSQSEPGLDDSTVGLYDDLPDLILDDSTSSLYDDLPDLIL